MQIAFSRRRLAEIGCEVDDGEGKQKGRTFSANAGNFEDYLYGLLTWQVKRGMAN